MINKQKSLPDILKLRTYSTRSISIQKNPSHNEKQLEEKPTKVIKYVLHEPKERIFLAKIFRENLQKRSIQRDIERYKNEAELNRVTLKESQLSRFKLYLRNQDDNAKKYLKESPYKEQSPITRSPSPVLRVSTKNSLYFSYSKNSFVSPEHKISKKKPQTASQIRMKDVNDLLGKTKLFTIVYKSNLMKNKL